MSAVALSKLFESIDAKDTNTFVSFLTEDAVFRYGSQPPVQGKAMVGEAVSAFFGSIKALSHKLNETWEGNGSLVCRGEVTYTLPDDRQLTVPFVNVFGFDGELIRDYLVYVDPTPLMG